MNNRFQDSDKAKYVSSKHALGYIKNGMTIGLGTGSTAAWFIALLADFVRKNDLLILTTSTSNQTKKLAESLGLKIVSLDNVKNIDLTVDGADEFDSGLNLIKGGGGALLQEKIVAAASSKMIVIADETKKVGTLGKFPLPIEIVPFGAFQTEQNLSKLFSSFGYDKPKGIPRKTFDKIFLTDEGNYILDYNLKRIEELESLSMRINNIPGVVEHGIFTNLCDKVLVGSSDGSVDVYSCEHKSSHSHMIDLEEMTFLQTKIDGC